MARTSKMPKFNFKNNDLPSEEEFNQAVEKERGGKIFRPGRYEVVATGAEYDGPTEKDKSWYKLKVQFSGANGKEIRDMLLIPTKSPYYGEKRTTFVFRKLRNFCTAMGVELLPTNLPTIVGTHFEDIKSLVGLHFAVDIGYTRPHVKWLRKDGDENVFSIAYPDGSFAKDTNGEVLEFDNRDAAKGHAAEADIDIQDFPSITNYDTSETPNNKNTNTTTDEIQDEEW